jgi:hypothetical protein
MSFDSLAVPVLASDEGIWVLIPLAAIVMVIVIVKSVIKHRERMAKIGMGIDPDYDPADVDPNNPHASAGPYRRPHDPTSQVGGWGANMAFHLMSALATSNGPPPDAGLIALCIPVVAIVCGSVVMIVKSVIKHRERMAKIGMGIDPDYDPHKYDPNHPQAPAGYWSSPLDNGDPVRETAMSSTCLSLIADSPIVIDAGVFALLIPISAIVFGSLTVIVKSIINHRERMAKIGMGIDPDAHPGQQPPYGER